MRTKVSGHSGLPEDIELRMMDEKIKKKREETEQMFQDFLRLMMFHGIAPHERKKFLIRFAKWLEVNKHD